MGSERVSMELMDQRHRTRREGSDEQVGQRASFKFNIRAFHDAVLELGSVPLPVVTARIDRFIAEGGKGPYPDME